MKFGVFDQNDRSGLPLADQYENRLSLVELYDRLGFHCFHMSEHHGTSLEHDAIAQRVDGGSDPADQEIETMSARLSIADLPSRSSLRRDLHSRSPERRSI